MGQILSSCKRQQPKKAKIISLFKEKKDTPIIPSEYRKFFPEEAFENEEDYRPILPLFSNICFDKLPSYLLYLRNSTQQNREGQVTLAEPTIQTPALFGSMHVAFVVVFPDGLKWLLKISANGYPGQFTKLEAKSLKSEALTMQLVKRETKIPLPEVYAFDNSFENPINSPFILMEFVEGVPLYQVWFNPEVPPDVREQHRETVLRDIAQLMPQLNKFTQSQGGSPLFDSQNNLTGVTSLKELNMVPVWKCDTSTSAVFHETGPFSSLQSYLRSFPLRDPDEVDGWHKLFLHYLDWIPENAGNDPKDQSFVLTHTDLALQNIFVTPDGHVTSLIDWDGAAFVPRCLGNERYPLWLLSDWNPLQYNWSSKPDSTNGGCDMCCHSPQELSNYRAMYQKFILEASNSSTPSSVKEEPNRSSLPMGADRRPITSTTHNSLIIANLKASMNLKYLEPEMVNKIYNEIINVQTSGRYKSADDLPVMDRRNLFVVCDMLEAEEKLKKKKPQEGEDTEASNPSEEDEKNEQAEEIDDDEDDDESDAESYEAESEEDEDEALRKRLEWIKEGFQKLFL